MLLPLAIAAALAAPGSWSTFARGEGMGWRARFHPVTGTATRAWGPPIALGPNVPAALAAFVERNPELFGGVELRPRSARYLARTDTWYVDYQQWLAGVPVWGSAATFRVRGQVLVMLGAEVFPGARPDGPVDPAGVIVAVPEGSGFRYRPARVVRSTTTTPPGRWTRLLAVDDGTELHAENAVRFLDGTLWGTHDVRTVDSGFATSPLPFATLEGSAGGVANALADGTFSVSDTETWTAVLESDYVRVTNEAGDEGGLVLDSSAPTFTDAVATQAEIDSYVFLHQVRDWGAQFAPGLAFLDDQVRSKVNVSVTCFAFWDGAVNLGIEGDGCNNAGRIADSNYHEWGHGLHEASVLSGSVDSTIGEGFSDLVAAMQTLDPNIAPNFYDDGRPTRDLTVLRVYPADIRNNIYQDGLIYSGAAWDLLLALQALYGESPTEKGTAWAVSSQLLVDAIAGGPSLTTMYDEYALADDDDADLSNGTPHLCLIVDAFGAHGLGPAMDPFPATIDHLPLENQPAGTPVPVLATVESLAPGCLSIDVASVSVTWTVDGSEPQTSPLALVDGVATGELPAFAAGSVVEYSLEATAADGLTHRLPAVGTHSFYVGNLYTPWCEDFSAGEGGFEHDALSGAGAAADDWAFGPPLGMSGDPVGAYSGESAWGNDFDLDGAYPYDVVNRLYAPPLDVTPGDPVVVQFRRWLTLDENLGDAATVYANEEPVWTSREQSDDGWVLHTLLLQPTTSPLELSWELSADALDSAGGWTVDDVCVYATRAPVVDTGDTGDTGEVVDTADSAGDSDSDGDTAKPGDPQPDEPCGCEGAGLLPVLAFLGWRRRARSP